MVSQRAARFWDENRGLAEEPTFWMAHPVCRHAINRRVTGSAQEWPLDWFKRRYGVQPVARGLSWGSGLGEFERWAIRLGIVSAVDAFDVSSVSIREAEQAAAAEGIQGITYKLGDFNRPLLEQAKYDIVFFHASLHHVGNLEGSSARSRAPSGPEGQSTWTITSGDRVTNGGRLICTRPRRFWIASRHTQNGA